MKCSTLGKTGYKYGESGKCFTGKDAKDKANSVAAAIHASKLGKKKK